MTPAIALYVHWPYCARICPYCDFNVYRARSPDNALLIDAIAKDLAAHRARMGPRVALSLYFGGGTPSLLSGAEVSALIEAANAAFPLSPDCEITLEANPEDASCFADFAAAGVNRLSLGVQSLRDEALAALFRNHDSASARRAVEAAARAFPRVSVDLIYARHGQSLEDWRAELAEALLLPVEHFSLYALTIEGDTAFARSARRGALTIPEGDLAADFFEATHALCDAAGAPAYEISNFARNEAARSRHNLAYWRSGEWVGVGPGAHGRVEEGALSGRERLATRAHLKVSDYVAAVGARGVGWDECEKLDGAAIADERLAMGLRSVEGVARAFVEEARGAPLSEAVLATLRAEGVLAPGDPLRLTRRGMMLADYVAGTLAC